MKPFIPQELPLEEVAWEPLIPLIGKANWQLAEYNGVLTTLPNPELLLAPLTTQEAVLSSLKQRSSFFSNFLQTEPARLSWVVSQLVPYLILQGSKVRNSP